MRLMTIAAGVAMAAAGSAMADDRPETWGVYLAPQVGWLDQDGERNMDANNTWGIGVGYQFNNRYAAELSWSNGSTDGNNGNQDTDLDVRRLDIFRSFSPRGRTTPFLVAGLSDTDRDNSGVGGDSDDTAWNLGGGFRYAFNDNLSLRWDVRAIRSMQDNVTEWGTNLALVYLFAKQEAAPPPAPAPAPVPREGDADGDGVLDSADRCPDTPRNLQVDERGCPILTKQGVDIDLHVNFAFDRSEVQTQYYPRIEAVSDFMKKYPGTSATLEGHTDSTGPDSYNQGLSERRANAVREIFLNKYGIAPERVEAVGYGEAKPIADNSTKEGRAENRRTTAVLKATRMEYKKR